MVDEKNEGRTLSFNSHAADNEGDYAHDPEQLPGIGFDDGLTKSDEAPVTYEKKYSFRKLNSTDLFLMIKIIGKIGLDELAQIFEGNALQDLISKAKGEGNDKNVALGIAVIFKLANKILENLSKCEQEVYYLLGNVSGLKKEEIAAFDLDVFMEMLMDFITKEEFRNFFKVASRYIKKLG